MSSKPPLGVVPRFIMEEKRLEELFNAIMERLWFNGSKILCVPTDWVGAISCVTLFITSEERHLKILYGVIIIICAIILIKGLKYVFV